MSDRTITITLPLPAVYPPGQPRRAWKKIFARVGVGGLTDRAGLVTCLTGGKYEPPQ